MNFNLLDEKWIPVLQHDGRWDRVSIRTALIQAARIRQIAASNPMDHVALLRFLLAVLYWCRGNPPTDRDGNKDDPFPPTGSRNSKPTGIASTFLEKDKRFYSRLCLVLHGRLKNFPQLT